MKRQSLYLGGALLATTALSTMSLPSTAEAGTFINYVTSGDMPTTTLTAVPLSAQIFPASSPEDVTLALTNNLTINFSNALTTTFDVEVESTNSDFTAGAIAVLSEQENGSLDVVVQDLEGCTVQVLTERILVEDCLAPDGVETLDALSLMDIVFDEANGLATAGTSIMLSGIVRGQSQNTFETITSAAVVTSRNSLATTITAGQAGTISNTSRPPFSELTKYMTSFTLGTVGITGTAAVGTNLATPITEREDLTGPVEFTITHGVLTDAAVTSLNLGGTDATVDVGAIPSTFNGNVASFDVSASEVFDPFDIVVNFDGTTAISAWLAGTVDVAFSEGLQNLTAAPTASGSLASLSRFGFSTQINTAQSSAGTGATLFQSFVRIVNNGAIAGPVNLTVRNDATGSIYGTYTTATVDPNSTVQVSMPTVEAALSITPAGQYQIGIAGPISGYAQHVMFNAENSAFNDLSSFRNETP